MLIAAIVALNADDAVDVLMAIVMVILGFYFKLDDIVRELRKPMADRMFGEEIEFVEEKDEIK